jgi:triosephosphate isomerase
MQKLLVANWKENPRTEAGALKLFKETAAAKRKNVDVVICPPFLYLEEIATAFRKMKARNELALGAQDVFWEERGAFTSEVGPKMLRSLGARYVIIGHSERRRDFKETDAMVNKKIKLALKDGLHVILCVGEPLVVRKRGIAAAQHFIKNQLKKDLAGISKITARDRGIRLAVAYEPIWAIGSGKNDNPEDAAAMADFIKKLLKVELKIQNSRFLYGGSVHGKNIRDYVQYKSIDGALVGGASLKAGEFKKIINQTNG